MNQVYIIAEAGVNHNGDIELAKKLVLEAKRAGANAVKFQTFKAEKLVSEYAPKAKYQLANTKGTETQKEMLKRLELSYQDFLSLNKLAEEIGIDFLSTPFDEESIDFLNTLNMPCWKIPSGEITNLPYLLKIKDTGRPVIISTGMATMEEIEAAVAVFESYDKGNIMLLHCNTEYPTPYEDVNLKAMLTLKEAFLVEVGYSDHTKGNEIALAAVAIGAKVIEKHFTIDKGMEGPDHKASLDVDELKLMIEAIRNIEVALGNTEKKPSPSEEYNRLVVRKSIVAKKAIRKGEILQEGNMTTKRPGNGISPMEWFDLIGTKAMKDYDTDEQIVKE